MLDNTALALTLTLTLSLTLTQVMLMLDNTAGCSRLLDKQLIYCERALGVAFLPNLGTYPYP